MRQANDRSLTAANRICAANERDHLIDIGTIDQSAVAGVDVRGRNAVLQIQRDLHDRLEALDVGLLINGRVDHTTLDSRQNIRGEIKSTDGNAQVGLLDSGGSHAKRCSPQRNDGSGLRMPQQIRNQRGLSRSQVVACA